MIVYVENFRGASGKIFLYKSEVLFCPVFSIRKYLQDDVDGNVEHV